MTETAVLLGWPAAIAAVAWWINQASRRDLETFARFAQAFLGCRVVERDCDHAPTRSAPAGDETPSRPRRRPQQPGRGASPTSTAWPQTSAGIEAVPAEPPTSSKLLQNLEVRHG